MDEIIQETSEVPEYVPVIGTWERLAETEKPIVMYGIGDGAEKILAVMEENGIRPSEFMASDEFVRGHSFRGFRVKTLSEIEEQYSDFLLVICFGTSRPDVMERITRLSERYETLVPDVPVVGEGLFESYISEHESDIMELTPLFADDKSREIFDALMKYRITGELSVLRGCETEKEEALGLLGIGNNETFMDLGAYDGDTAERFMKLTDKHFEKIIAVEPDRRNYAKLRRRLYCLGSDVYEHYNAAVCAEDGPVTFFRRAGRSSSLEKGSRTKTKGRPETIDGRSVDSILGGRKATLIKYDVEGSEEQALLGSAETIKKYKPRLIVSLYHRTEDMVSLPLLVHKLNPDYRLYLRHHPYIPAWDTNLYCI